MGQQFEEIVTNLNDLLQDICEFLSNRDNYQNLSPNARRKADELIKRSKYQLLDIANITKKEPEEGYVDMQTKSEESKDKEDDLKQDIYASIDEAQLEINANPFGNLPYKDVLQSVKVGPLFWKVRFVLLKKAKRIWAAIHENWLLIYSNERDTKPLQTFFLKYYSARIVDNKNAKDFELLCLSEPKKSYYFITTAHKDMIQWVTSINRCHALLNAMRKSYESDVSEEIYYDTLVNVIGNNFKKNQEEKSEEATYDAIVPVRTTNPQLGNFRRRYDVTRRRPKLPVRGPKVEVPLPPIPSEQQEHEKSNNSNELIKSKESPKSRESIKSNDSVVSYDPVGSNPSVSGESFSSGGSHSDIYEVFVITI